MERVLEMKTELVVFLIEEEDLNVNMTGKDWEVIGIIVPLLKVFKDLTVTMSDRYANASIIIPEIVTMKGGLESRDAKKIHKGVGATVNQLLGEINSRYKVYLENPNLLLATFLDPRFKHFPLKTITSTEKVEEFVLE